MCVFLFFAREQEYRWKLESYGGRDHEIYTVFEVEYSSRIAAVVPSGMRLEFGWNSVWRILR